VHDFYRRFIKRDASEHHYVRAGQLATVILFVLSSSMVFVLESAQDNFNIMLQVGAGTGLLYLLRWFWWRITAWCEIIAMASSFLISIAFVFLHKAGMNWGTHRELLATVLFTTVCWIAVAFFGPQTDRRALIEFYKKVRPFGPGWRDIQREAGISDAEAAAHAKADNIPLAMIGWVSGSIVVWSGLFTVGNFLYGRMGYAWGLLGVLVLSGAVLIHVIRKLWR
jgi:SSS family solute:Na+ symporter